MSGDARHALAIRRAGGITPMFTSVKRVAECSVEEFDRDFRGRNQPVIVTKHPGIAEAALRWSIDYLVSKHPDQSVSVETYPGGDRNQSWNVQSMKLADYAVRIRDRPAARDELYLAAQPLEGTLPNTFRDVPPPSFIAHQKLLGQVFVGVDTYSNAHYHSAPYEAVLMQIVGTKRLVLCPAEHYQSFYPCAWYSGRSNWSRIGCDTRGAARAGSGGAYFLQADDPAFPKAREAPLLECVLQPGESLFIPQGWFHVVYGVGEAISVTYFFKGSWRHAHFPIAVRDALTRLRSVWDIAAGLKNRIAKRIFG